MDKRRRWPRRRIINDELMLDENLRLNLAPYVTTWMEPEYNKLID